MKKKAFERELPPGYREIYSLDAKNSKLGVWMNAVGLLLSAAVLVPAFFWLRPDRAGSAPGIWFWLTLLAVNLAYVVLHELVHGAAYKLLTGEKLTFGISFTVAFCGVPNIYSTRKTALISLLAPFTVFTLVFGLPLFFVQDLWTRCFFALMLSIHVGGCVGDLYDTALYLFRFRDPRTLMRDTGPAQFFYVPEGAPSKEE